MSELEFKAYRYARLNIELALSMGWLDICDTSWSDEELTNKFKKEYLEDE